MDSDLKRIRVTVYRNGEQAERTGGKAMFLPDTMQEFLSVCSERLGIPVMRVFFLNGGEVEDIELIQNDDILVVSAGEEFEDGQGTAQKFKTGVKEAGQKTKEFSIKAGKATKTGAVFVADKTVEGASKAGKWIKGLFTKDAPENPPSPYAQ